MRPSTKALAGAMVTGSGGGGRVGMCGKKMQKYRGREEGWLPRPHLRLPKKQNQMDAPGPRPAAPSPIENPMLAKATVSASRPGGGTGPAKLVRGRGAGRERRAAPPRAALCVHPRPRASKPSFLPLSHAHSSPTPRPRPPGGARSPWKRGLARLTGCAKAGSGQVKEKAREGGERVGVSSDEAPPPPSALTPLRFFSLSPSTQPPAPRPAR